ncbi:MAG: hypothetical protein LIP01_07930 [Tannerellaceae bacterium]|nr:hypothetical protein [Tannerellaceae bacterium]
MKTINIVFRPVIYVSVVVFLGISFSCMDDVYESESSLWGSPGQNEDFDEERVFTSIYASLALTGQDVLGGNDGKWEGMGNIDNYAFFSTLFLLNELSTDEAICTWDDYAFTRLNFNEWWNDNSEQNIALNFFKRLMYNIHLCNHYLENIDESGKLDERKLAEVYFLRALNYYYMMDLFNPVLEISGTWNHPFFCNRTGLVVLEPVYV